MIELQPSTNATAVYQDSVLKALEDERIIAWSDFYSRTGKLCLGHHSEAWDVADQYKLPREDIRSIVTIRRIYDQTAAMMEVRDV